MQAQSFYLCASWFLGVTKVSKYVIDLRELSAHSRVPSFFADPLKDFLHVLRLFVPVGLTLLASGLSLVAQSTQVQWKESSLSFDESAGIISLTIVRSGDMFGSKTVS